MLKNITSLQIEYISTIITFVKKDMVKKIAIFLSIVFVVMGCEKDNSLVDPNYPTTFLKIDSVTQTQRIAKLLQENEYLRTSINEFGFCDLTSYDYDRTVKYPTEIDPLTESEATNVITNFISQNRDITGINEPENIRFKKKNQKIFSSSLSVWYCKIANQLIDTVELMNSIIIIHLKNGKVTRCEGNWYPEVYIPNSFNLNQEEAKSVLINKEVMHFNWGNIEEVTVSAEDLEESEVRLVIYPIITENKIELHVTWEVYVPSPVHYLFYVDVMTGDIIVKEPTIVS